MSQHSEVILQIMAEVDNLDAHPHTKHTLRKFINETCLAAGITIVDRQERVQYARRMLDAGEPRPVIRDRLIARFLIKKTAAYAAIDGALKLSAKERISRKDDAQNFITDSTNDRH